MRNPPKLVRCSFCNAEEPPLVIRSHIGGEPPVICAECVGIYARQLAAFIPEAQPE